MAGLELADSPAPFVLESVVVTASRSDVAVARDPTARPVLNMVAVRAVRGSATARVRAGAVADLGTAPQRPSWAARSPLVVAAWHLV
jgi:hypothetical protein